MGTTVYMWLGPGPRGQWWPSQAFSPIKYMLEGWLGRGGGITKIPKGTSFLFRMAEQSDVKDGKGLASKELWLFLGKHGIILIGELHF